MKKVWTIGGGVVGVLIGMAFVMPALAQVCELGVMTGLEAALLFLGVVLTLGGVWAIGWAAKRRWA